MRIDEAGRETWLEEKDDLPAGRTGQKPARDEAVNQSCTCLAKARAKCTSPGRSSPANGPP